MKDRDWRVQDLNLRRGQSSGGKVGSVGVRVQDVAWGQSSMCLRVPTRERWERRASGVPCVSLQLWHTYVSGTWLLRILAHDRWIQVLHLLHSIMARPAKGFMQKHVTRSHESSSESTIISSSSPEPSSSLNTTCFPWRNTVLFPEKPSTFCIFTTPSSRSRPSQYRRSSLGSSLHGDGLGRHWGWRGMLMSSSGSSLIVRPPKESGHCSSGTAEWAPRSSPDWCSLSFLLFFFFFSLSAFLRSSGCRVVIVWSFLAWLDNVGPGCGRFLLLSWGPFRGRWGQEEEDSGGF